MEAKLIALGLITMAIGAGGATAYLHEYRPLGDRAAPVARAAPAEGAQIRAGIPDFRSIVERYGPAVVNISTEGLVKRDVSQLAPDDPLAQLLGALRMPPIEVPVRGQGSGFIMSPDGIVLTNAHVVRDASQVTVKLTDRREFRAKVLGSDSFSDIAVLKIEATNLPVVQLGNAVDVRPGEWVVAIGSPFGFENTVTAGIVSAKRRALPGDGYVPFIQTDAPVNPGSSGGPLFNRAGEVIGINSQILSATGGYQGLAFAIPIDIAVRVEKQIVATGHATHAQLGITVQELSQPLAQSFGLHKLQGALVSSIARDSAAARAGLEPGDVILKAKGRPIIESGDLPEIIDQSSPGQRITLEVWRRGAARELTAMLRGVKEAVAAEASDATAATPNRLGLVVRPLSPDERREAQVTSGIMVEGAAGVAARAGIQPGDIVLAVNGFQMNSPQALGLVAGKAEGTVALLVQRGNLKMFVPLSLG